MHIRSLKTFHGAVLLLTLMGLPALAQTPPPEPDLDGLRDRFEAWRRDNPLQPDDPEPSPGPPADGDAQPAPTTVQVVVDGTARDLGAPCEGCPEMVAIPGGRFTMGSPDDEEGRTSDEEPLHWVAIQPFEIGKYEVTFAQWDACVADGYCRRITYDAGWGDAGWGRGNRPVINVSWNDITGETVSERGFLAWMNAKVDGAPYRLPSEAEWEYAARAGTTGAFSFEGPISTDRANYDGTYTYGGSAKGEYRRKTVEAGALPANPWGLHEVHGNVWEWVQDCWHGNYNGAPTDGSAWMAANGGDCSRSVLRGGSWFNYPRDLRSALRLRNLRTYGSVNFGFRLARTLP